MWCGGVCVCVCLSLGWGEVERIGFVFYEVGGGYGDLDWSVVRVFWLLEGEVVK